MESRSAVSENEPELTVREFSYNWKIHVRDLFSDVDVKSAAFSEPNAHTGNFWLEIIGCQDENGDLCVRLGLRLLADSAPVNGKVRFAIEGTEFQGSEVINDFSPLEPGELSSVMYSLPLVVITKWANGKIEDQNLTVYCHLWLYLPSKTVPMVNLQTTSDKSLSNKLEREDLWDSKARWWGCDVIIRCPNTVMTNEILPDRVSYSSDVYADSPAGVAMNDDKLSSEFSKQIKHTSCRPQFVPYRSGDEVELKASIISKVSQGSEYRGQTKSRRKMRVKNSASGDSPNSASNNRRFLEDSHLFDSCSGTTVVESDTDAENDEDQFVCMDQKGWIVELPCKGDSPRSGKKSVSSPILRQSSGVFRDGIYTDFPVHRLILSVRSPVFRQMLSDPDLNLIRVTDVTSGVMNELLRFIYTGAVARDAIDSNAEDLLYAANKYEINHLKHQCEAVLSNTITVANTCRLMFLADTNSAEQLKDSVINFAIKENQDVFRSLEYRKFHVEHPDLANELMLSVFSNVTAMNSYPR